MASDIVIQRPYEVLGITADTSTELRDILSAIDSFYEHELGQVAGVRRNESIVAWNEAVAGPAPGGVSQTAKDRGALIEAARADWEGDPPRTLKAGAQTLLDQYGG